MGGEGGKRQDGGIPKKEGAEHRSSISPEVGIVGKTHLPRARSIGPAPLGQGNGNNGNGAEKIDPRWGGTRPLEVHREFGRLSRR